MKRTRSSGSGVHFFRQVRMDPGPQLRVGHNYPYSLRSTTAAELNACNVINTLT